MHLEHGDQVSEILLDALGVDQLARGFAQWLPWATLVTVASVAALLGWSAHALRAAHEQRTARPTREPVREARTPEVRASRAARGLDKRSPIERIVDNYNTRHAFVPLRRGLVLFSIGAALAVPSTTASLGFAALAGLVVFSLAVYRRPIDLHRDVRFVPDALLGLLATAELDRDTRTALRCTAVGSGGVPTWILVEHIQWWKHCRGHSGPGFRAFTRCSSTVAMAMTAAAERRLGPRARSQRGEVHWETLAMQLEAALADRLRSTNTEPSVPNLLTALAELTDDELAAAVGKEMSAEEVAAYRIVVGARLKSTIPDGAKAHP